jgi:hypothetical protein
MTLNIFAKQGDRPAERLTSANAPGAGINVCFQDPNLWKENRRK